MVEIAVDLMLIHNTAIYANALKEEEGVVEELQHLPELPLAEAVMSGLEMGIVMTSITIKTAVMMMEIAVDLMLIHNIVIYVNALKEEEGVVAEELQLSELAVRVGLLMGIVMISITI